jgi:hypothetical protein
MMPTSELCRVGVLFPGGEMPSFGTLPEASPAAVGAMPPNLRPLTEVPQP